ncbi:serine hydrolase domain-containing protein [Vagococcus teuberi]
MFEKTIATIELMHQDKIIPGANYLFLKQGDIQKGVIGFKEVMPEEISATHDTLYDMASLTKVMMTNTLVLQLIEKNVLDIDAPFKTYLPSWHEERVTLRHLLTHTSAVYGYIEKRDELSGEELKQSILRLPVNKSIIGKKKVYTDTGTLLIGFMLEDYYKQNLHDLFTEKVLHPLGMTSSGFTNIDKTKCAPTQVTKTRGVIKGEVHDPKAYQLKEHCGSAGLFSTIDDSFKFVQMMLNKGALPSDDKMLLPETIESLLQDYTPTATLSRSLGWDLRYHLEKKHPILYHTGYTGTFMLIDIIEQEAFIFLSNRVHPYDNRQDYIRKRDELIEVFQKEQTN